MKKNEKAILRCRSDYAYGDSGQGKIPAGATLNFDVELISFGPKKKESWEYTDEEKWVEGESRKRNLHSYSPCLLLRKCCKYFTWIMFWTFRCLNIRNA